MRALFIAPPWIDMTLRGDRIWDIRNHAVKTEQTIALVDDSKCAIVGTARIVDCRGPYTYDQLLWWHDRHRIPMHLLRELVYDRYGNKAYAWHLDDVQHIGQPIPVRRAGSSIWAFDEDTSPECVPITPARVRLCAAATPCLK